MADLTSTAAVKAFAGVTTSGDDVAIGGVVSACSVLLHGIIGHDYEGASLTGTHSSGRSGVIVLDKPAATIDAVRENGTTLAASDYELEDERLLWRLASGDTTFWQQGRRNIEVDYTTTSTIPADLELAAREISAWVWKQGGHATGSSRLGLSAQANADTGTADYFAQAIRQLPVANAVLRRFKRYA